MSDEYETSMSMPLDSDGFLRRECPTCEREFKVFVDQENSGQADPQGAPPGGYYCPYCAIQAEPNAWFTKPQLAAARSKIMDEVVAPMLDDLTRSLGSSPFVSINTNNDDEPAPELTESDDMRRVDLACHPETPVKVAEDYAGAVHCMICGQRAESAS
jgi:hypothetical protein